MTDDYIQKHAAALKPYPKGISYEETLRDQFAAKAMVMHGSALSRAHMTEAEWHSTVARLAYATADALLRERAK